MICIQSHLSKLSFSPNDTFIRQLKLWAEGSLSDLTCATLLIRLDPFGVGGVTPSNLDLLCGDRSLKETFRMFAATGQYSIFASYRISAFIMLFRNRSKL
jgi:hypothetical protein